MATKKARARAKPPTARSKASRYRQSAGDYVATLGEDFRVAASRLITRGRRPVDITSAQRDAMSIVGSLLTAFVGGTSAGHVSITWEPCLRRAAKELRLPLTEKRERRAATLEQVEQVACLYHSPDWDAPTAKVSRLDALVRPLALTLATVDSAFSSLTQNLGDLDALLANWSPSPRFKAGRMGTTRIVAELSHRCQALGYDQKKSISWIREDLDEEIRRYKSSRKSGE